MADLTSAYAALKNADAAGDTVAAQKLADYIKAQATAPASPAPQPGAARPGEDPLVYTGRAIVGAGEAALSGITGGAGSLADAVTGSQPGTHDWAYRPRTQAGQEITQGMGQAVSAVNNKVAQGGGAVVGALGGNQQAATDELASRLPEAEGAIGTITTAGGLLKGAGVGAPKPGAAAVTDAAQAAANKATSSGSMGAAGAAVDASKLTPETQAELAKTSAPNATALARTADAESLPVPVRLTAGQARGDAAMISDEFNRKGQEGNAIGNRYNEQDQALQDNLGEIHRQAAPDTVGNGEIQNGQAIIDSLKRYDQPKVAAINSAYQAAKDANGGDLQMDGSNFVDSAQAALKPQGRARFLPSSVQGIIDDVQSSKGQMSLDDFEGYRTALANEVRKAQQSGDGNAVGAINKVRDALESTPPADGTSAAAKGLYDNARGLAKARFGEMQADPAYEAAVGDPTPIGRLSPDADKFAQKYVLNGAKADLQQLRPKLDDEGSQAMTSTAMNYLQKQAGVDKGKFLQNGYNTALNKIGPKADELLPSSDVEEQLKQVGRVANYTQAQSRGGYANNSHTLVAAAAAHGLGYLQDTANAAVPFAKLGDKAAALLEAHKSAKAINEVLKPGAGLAD